MLNNHRKGASQKGLTLIEMLIALVLGLFVTAIIISVFSTNVRSSNENIRMIRLNQELRGVMTLMVDEIKRHGYSFDPTDNNFMNKLDYDSANTCLNYSYDSDTTDGSFDASKDLFAFQLRSDNIIYWNTTSCAPSIGGQPLTETNIANITTLNFDFSGSANTNGASGLTALTTLDGVSVYDVTITLTGTTDLPHSSEANDPRRTIIETIRMRNEDPKD
jgi:prepilin-type N-terminal cleavage/methylation domain-containing protein|tara:strand:- start:14417 stop:15073 length:657 start_codon:yes stop_codon:yes gene_type:complete